MQFRLHYEKEYQEEQIKRNLFVEKNLNFVITASDIINLNHDLELIYYNKLSSDGLANWKGLLSSYPIYSNFRPHIFNNYVTPHENNWIDYEKKLLRYTYLRIKKLNSNACKIVLTDKQKIIYDYYSMLVKIYNQIYNQTTLSLKFQSNTLLNTNN